MVECDSSDSEFILSHKYSVTHFALWTKLQPHTTGSVSSLSFIIIVRPKNPRLCKIYMKKWRKKDLQISWIHILFITEYGKHQMFKITVNLPNVMFMLCIYFFLIGDSRPIFWVSITFAFFFFFLPSIPSYVAIPKSCLFLVPFAL